MNRSLVLTILSGTLAMGCAHPQHLQYDYGRAYVSIMQTQADLGRPSVADADYGLSGIEGLELRSRVTEEATDQESGQAEAVKKFDVQ